MIVVADTSPLNYLIQIDSANLLAHIYGRVLIPEAVWLELNHENAEGAKLGLIDPEAALRRLLAETNFRIERSVLQEFWRDLKSEPDPEN